MGLITLARAQQAIPHASGGDDSHLESLIDAASAAITTYCGRGFLSASYSEHLPTTAYGLCNLRNFPVRTGPTFWRCGGRGIKARHATATYATLTSTTTAIELAAYVSGATATTTLTYASYPTITAMVAAISGTSGWTAEATADAGPWPSSLLEPMTSLDASSWALIELYDSVVPIVERDDRTGSYTIDSAKEVVRADYSAGFAAIPDDVQQACALLVRDWFDADKRDADAAGQLQSKSLGDLSYSFAQRASGAAPMLDASARLLAKYRNFA